MKISIVTASFNAVGGLEKLAAMLRCQTHADIEWLVADGGSRDGTVAFLESAADVVTWWTSSPDAGIFDAWNRTIDHVTGDWVCFLGADDTFAGNDALARVATALSQLPAEALIAYGRVDLVKTSGETVQTIGKPWDARRFRSRGMSMPHQATFHRKALFERYGKFDLSPDGTATYEMLLRYLRDHDACFIDQTIARMELGGISTQPRNHMRFLRAYVRAQRRHGTFLVHSGLMLDLAQASAKSILFRALPAATATGLIQKARRLAGLKPHY